MEFVNTILKSKNSRGKTYWKRDAGYNLEAKVLHILRVNLLYDYDFDKFALLAGLNSTSYLIEGEKL